MASVHENHQTLIPVFCDADNISEKVLDKFFDEAYAKVSENQRGLYFVTSKSLPQTLQPSKSPIRPYSPEFLQDTRASNYIDLVSHHEQITHKAFVILDAATAKDNSTCRLHSPMDGAPFDYATRSDFCSVQIALDDILDRSSNPPRLRNQAAMEGGELRNYNRKAATSAYQDGDIVEFLNRPQSTVEWKNCCKRVNGFQDPIVVPVFCTANLPLEVLNQFIKEAYQPPGWPDEFYHGLRIIDSLDLKQLQSGTNNQPLTEIFSTSFLKETDDDLLEAVAASQTRAPYKEAFTSPFLNKTPGAIHRTVQSQFSGTKLNCILFIILDPISISEHTCIIANMHSMHEDPELILLRSDFQNALSTVISTTCTSLTFETLAQDQACRTNGTLGIS